MIWSRLQNYQDVGLLVMRLTAGLYMAVAHGWGKFSGGADVWVEVGGAMALLGIGFLPVVWGFFAAVAEFLGALCVAAGFLTRPAALLLVLNMTVATNMHIQTGNGSPEKAVIYGVLFLGIVVLGAGRYSVDDWMRSAA